MSGHFLIVEARFYTALADAQAAGAIAAPSVFLLMDGIRSNDMQTIVMSGTIVL